jgi:hypothetical protein
MNSIETIIKELIKGNTIIVQDEQVKEVQKQLREIKKNCTEVLTQLKERI